MKRRDFSSAAAGFAALALVGVDARAQGEKLIAGTHYQVLSRRAPVDVPPDKIEVVEFFWYNCPHCNVFEPTLDAWVKRQPKDVVVRRVPRRFADNEVPQQQLYYAMEAMGLVEKLHAKVFAAIHKEGKRLDRGDKIADWVVTQGVERAKFLEYYNSFAVQAKVSRALQLQESYKIEGVPALGVGGYYLTDVPMAGSPERALMVVDSLLAEIRAGRA
jgi:thiol:disulfide interchange protein DsbA